MYIAHWVRDLSIKNDNEQQKEYIRIIDEHEINRKTGYLDNCTISGYKLSSLNKYMHVSGTDDLLPYNVELRP
jgi:hypothetical protein